MTNGGWTPEYLRNAIQRCEAETDWLERAGLAEDMTSRRQGINTLRALLREVEENG